jgi:hypothetical protein
MCPTKYFYVIRHQLKYIIYPVLFGLILHLKMFQNIRPNSTLCITFRIMLAFYGKGLQPSPVQTPTWRATLVDCQGLLIQYLRNYPPCLKTVSSTCNLRTRNAVVTRDPINMIIKNMQYWMSLTSFQSDVCFTRTQITDRLSRRNN